MTRTRPPTTSEIVALYVVNQRTDQLAVDWAVDLLVRGYDTPALRQLAGESEPFYHYQMIELLVRVFRQLNLTLPESRKEGYLLLASESIRELLTGPISTNEALKILSELYDYGYGPEELAEFQRLRIAEEGIVLREDPIYWKYSYPEATLENIDQIVIDKCREWLDEYGMHIELPQPDGP